MQPQYNNEVIIFFIAAAIIVAGAAVFFFILLRIQHKRKQLYQKQLLEKEFKTREESFLQISRDLHDEVGSSLSGINLFAQMAGEQLEQNNITEAKINIGKASTYAGQVIEKVSDMAWLLKPSQESIFMLTEKLKTYGQAAAGAKKIKMHFDISLNGFTKELSLQQRKSVYLISKEAINNAVKYSGCKTIYYTMLHSGNTFRVSIKDDGIGFAEEDIVKGNGLNNMRARADETGTSIKISSASGKGTIIELEL
ncbi:MAG: histidine kinase [Chitinophagaceae bacterium]|nr:histidine kinase [Chitinophagaceae bacterium]